MPEITKGTIVKYNKEKDHNKDRPPIISKGTYKVLDIQTDSRGTKRVKLQNTITKKIPKTTYSLDILKPVKNQQKTMPTHTNKEKYIFQDSEKIYAKVHETPYEVVLEDEECNLSILEKQTFFKNAAKLTKVTYVLFQITKMLQEYDLPNKLTQNFEQFKKHILQQEIRAQQRSEVDK